MRTVFLLLFVFKGVFGLAQEANVFYTPWYGGIGVHTISSRYSDGSSEIKAPLTYADVRAVFFTEKGYMDFGIPVVGYFLTGLIAAGGDLPDDNGEVSFLYAKGGWDVYKNNLFRIGVGASLNAMLINVDGIVGYGASLESYGTLSPLVYAKINAGPFLIAPVFEYNAVSWTNVSGTSRPGFCLGSHVIIPLGERLGINLNPSFEKGNFRSNQGGSMTSSSVVFKAGIVIRPD